MPHSDCPHCLEPFRVPDAPLPRDAQARCPWCGARFPLADVLQQLPPMLELFTPDGEPIDLDTTSAAAPGFEQGGTGLDSKREDEIEGVSAIVLDESNRSGAADIERLSRHDAVSSPAAVTTQPSSMRVQPNPAIELRHKKRRNSSLRTLIGIALGPVIALPIAAAILLALGKEPDLGFYPFDGTYGDEPERRAAPIPLDDGTPGPPPRSPQPAPQGRSLSGELGADRNSPRSGVDTVGGLAEVPPDRPAALAEFDLEKTEPTDTPIDESPLGAAGSESASSRNRDDGQPPEPAKQPQAEGDEPQAELDEPQAEDEQFEAEDEQFEAEDEQPEAEDEQPEAEDEQPEAEDEQPEVGGEQPQAVDDQPQAERDVPPREVAPPQSEAATAAGSDAEDSGAVPPGPRAVPAESAETVTSTDAREIKAQRTSRADLDEDRGQVPEPTPGAVAAARDSAIERLEAVGRVDVGDRQRYRTRLAYAYQSVAKLAETAGRDHQESLSAVTEKLRETGLIDVFAKAAPEWLSLPQKSRGTDGALLVGNFQKTSDGYALRLNDRRAVPVRLSHPGKPPGAGKQMVLGRMQKSQSELVVEVLLSEPVRQ